MRHCALAALGGFVLCTSIGENEALAWGASGQRMIAALATRSLPPEIPNFLKTGEAGRQIGEVSREPDRVRSPDTNPTHYIEAWDDLTISSGPSRAQTYALAFVALSALPATRESYDAALRAAGANPFRTGYLPYSILDAWRQLVVDFAYYRADVAGVKYVKTPSEQTFYFRDQHIREGLTARDLGILAHFVGDGSDPLRVSVHRQGWGDYPNPRAFSTATNLLARFEGTVTRARLTENDVSPRMTPYRDCHCMMLQRISDYLAASQKQVATLYEIEKADGFDGKHDSGKAFVSQRLGAAAAEFRDLVVDAWRASAEASIGSPPVALSDIESGKENAFNVLAGSD